MLPRAAVWGRTVSLGLRRAAPHGAGVMVGLCVIAWWGQTLASLGQSLALLAGLLVAAAVGLAWGLRNSARALTPFAASLCESGLAVWTVLLPMLTTLPRMFIGSLSAGWLETASGEFAVGLASGGLLLTVPHALVGMLLSWPGDRTASASSLRRMLPTLTGVAVALLVAPVSFIPGAGLFVASVIGAVGCLACGCWYWRLADSAGQTGVTEMCPADRDATRPGSPLMLSDCVLPLVAGAGMALAGEVLAQLWLNGLYCGFAQAAGVAGGMVLSVIGTSRGPEAGSALRRAALGLFVAVWVVVLMGAFAIATDLVLWVNASSPEGGMVVAFRGLACALLTAPAGYLLGLELERGRAMPGHPWRSLSVMLFVAGWITLRWTLPNATHAAWAVFAVGVYHAASSWSRAAFQWPAGRVRRLGIAAAAGLCACAPLLMRNYDPARSARLLFSSRVIAGLQSTADAEMLMGLDDLRLTDVVTGRDACWTAWRFRGDSLLLRENGMPQGQIGLDWSTAPDSPAEAMATVLSLAIPPKAEHVLVVGLGSGATPRNCLEFPVRTLTCLEPDRELTALVKSLLAGHGDEWLQDVRLRWRTVSPVLAAAMHPAQAYDVILLNARQLIGPRSAGTSTMEYYQGWRDQLSPWGVLCQRFEYFDIGSPPLQDLVATLSAVFPQVMVFESSPGELLLMASRSEEPLVTEELLTRMDTPHVRRVLGRISWDWSLPLSLVAMPGEQAREKSASLGRVAHVANPRLEWMLPGEFVRRANKMYEVRSFVASGAKTVVSMLPENSARMDVQQRLADVQEQRSLISRFPDHYWAYRKVLKERLLERPRSVIQQVKYELHPEDQRRKDYLEALGKAATTREAAPELLSRLATFAEPYDPLVSPFVHGELAQLLAHSTPRQPSLELLHRLHAIYFAPNFDRSVRDTVSAIALLLDHEDALLDPQRRWDHVNGLMEVLKERWTLRSQQQQLSRFDPIDARETLAVAQQAIEFLEREASKSGIDAEWAAIRCRVLDRTLVRALRTYQSAQTSKLQELKQQQAAKHQSNLVE